MSWKNLCLSNALRFSRGITAFAWLLCIFSYVCFSSFFVFDFIVVYVRILQILIFTIFFFCYFPCSHFISALFLASAFPFRLFEILIQHEIKGSQKLLICNCILLGLHAFFRTNLLNIFQINCTNIRYVIDFGCFFTFRFAVEVFNRLQALSQ